MADLRFSYGTGKRGGQPYNRLYSNSPAGRRRAVHSEDFRYGVPGPFVYTQAATGDTILTTPGAPSFAQGATGFLRTPGGLHIDMFATTAQTILPILTPGTGLEISLDQVDNESVEYVPGGNSDYNPFAYTVGTSTPTVFRVALKIADASGSDQLLVGWRKREAFAVPTSFLTTGDGIYTDFLGIGFAATKANPNPISIAYDVNNGGSTFVNAGAFTWADGLTHVLEVRLIGGQCRLLINGARLGNAIAVDGLGGSITSQQTSSAGEAAFNALDGDSDGVKGFDTGDILVPFIFVRQDADVTGAVSLQGLEIGPLSEFGLDTGNEPGARDLPQS